jgi:hypothetical protein
MKTPMIRRLTAKQVAILKNAPGRNASVEKAVLKTTEALNTALEAIGGQLRAGATADLHRILKVALNLSRAKGVYEGLQDGFRLHELSLEIEGDPTTRTILRRIRKYRPGDEEVSNEGLIKYLDGEIQRLDGNEGQPFPPAGWKISDTMVRQSKFGSYWRFALKGPDRKLRQRVSTYFNRKRHDAWGKEYAFLVAWEELAQGIRKDQEQMDRLFKLS